MHKEYRYLLQYFYPKVSKTGSKLSINSAGETVVVNSKESHTIQMEV